MKKKTIIIVIAIMAISISILTLLFFKVIYSNLEEPNLSNSSSNSSFDYELIKEVNKNKSTNYLISPYSIKTVLSIIKDGSDTTSLKELNDVMGNFTRGNLNSKDIMSDANLLLIENNFKDLISNDYVKKIERNYDAEIKYSNITPEVVNKWVDNKTNHMIPKLVDNIDPTTVAAIVNAISLKATWETEFDCKNTRISKFNTIDGTEVNTIMMMSNDAKYIANDTAKGIIKSYETYRNSDHKKVSLEYIAIMPNDSIDSYIENFNNEEFRELLNTQDEYKDEEVSLKLPRYSYEYEEKELINILTNMGIKSIFNEETADLSKMTSNNSERLYVGSMNHKAYIEVNEKGTSAAAATIATIDSNSISIPIDIEFDRPFIYIIKQSNSDDILFFGVVYTPTLANNETDFCN